MQIIAKAAHIERRLMPLPHRFWEVNSKESGTGAELENSSPEVTDNATICLHTDSKEIPEQLKVRGHSEETLAEGDEIRNVKNPLGDM